VYSGEAIKFFDKVTGCHAFTEEPKRAKWQRHEFWLFGRPGALYTLSTVDAINLGRRLASLLD
jgi:hypothetical protein